MITLFLGSNQAIEMEILLFSWYYSPTYINQKKPHDWLHKKNREQPIHLAMLIVLLLPKTISRKGNLIASSHLVDYVKKGGKLKNWGSLKFPSLCIWARAPPKTSISFSSLLQPCSQIIQTSNSSAETKSWQWHDTDYNYECALATN